MGGLFHLFNLNRNGMARKIQKHNQQVDGLEVPGNSLELPVETSLTYHVVDDNVTNSYHIKEEWSERNQCLNKRSMKKLMKQEISKHPNTRHKEDISKQSISHHKTPSIVARLMGIDSLPLDNERDSVIQKHENWKKEREESSSVSHVHSNSKFYKYSNTHYQCEKESRHTDSHNISKSSRLRARKHHQEEELFKEDFALWQAQKVKGCSRVLEVESIPRHQLVHKKYKDNKHTGYSKGIKSCSYECSASQHQRHRKDRVDPKTWSFIDFERFPIEASDIKHSEFSARSRIVILKPGSDGISSYEEDPCATSCISEERGSTDDFLEEVKERTEFKLQRGEIRSGCLDLDPKLIAQHIAKQVRESVGKDLEINLVRSKSCRTEHQFPSSKLTNRARNDPMEEAEVEFASTSGRSSIISVQGNDRDILKQSGSETETGSCSVYEADDDELFSPRNLSRSLSAPITDSSFRKLLLEDPHILSGNLKKMESGKLNFKDKVSGFGNAFTLSGKFLDRRFETDNKEQYLIKDLMSGPTVLNSNDSHENFTEVPPSPVSMHGDLAPDCHNPTAPLDLSSGEDDNFPQVFSEISSSLNELRRQLNELGSEVSANDNKELLETQPKKDESDEHSKTHVAFSLPISNYMSDESKTRCDSVDYKIVLDLASEVLSNILAPEAKMSAFMKKLRVIYSPPVSLDRVWEVVWKYVDVHTIEQSDYLIESVVAGDLGRTPWLGLMNEEFDCMGRDVECLIIQDLIEETTKEFQMEMWI